jgi:hypothetical protein
MSRFEQKRAMRGSQKWLQILVNQAPHLLDRGVARELNLSGVDKIVWLSPKVDDALAEYRDEAFLTKLGAELPRTSLSSFWPTRGPQWDALGRTSRGELLLVEAKAHIPELLSPACRAAGKSLQTIHASIDRVKRAIGSRGAADWCENYYQYTNRLAHLYLLRKLNNLPAYLVFVYLLNDTDTSGPSTPEEWAGALKIVHTQLGIDHERLANTFGPAVIELFIDVKDIEAATT